MRNEVGKCCLKCNFAFVAEWMQGEIRIRLQTFHKLFPTKKLKASTLGWSSSILSTKEGQMKS